MQAVRRGGALGWAEAVALAGSRLDFLRTNVLDAVVSGRFGEDPAEAAGKPVRLAVLGSSTLAHLHAGIRVAGLRRGLRVSTYENGYGQYRQELADPQSGLHAFRPTAVLFAFDARHLAAGVHAGLDAAGTEAALGQAMDGVTACWRMAREAFGCRVLQQTLLPVFGPLLGNNEHRLAGSRAGFVQRVNEAMRAQADAAGVDLVALDVRAAADGLAAWHDPAIWHRAKQEVSPAAAPFYGDLVARVLAAGLGRSSKCLVLDLDNTLWGGVVGDDGVDGLVLGQGSGPGEAFAAVQAYAKELSRRGVILAVCSKNDEANAMEAFERHPEMVLRRDDVACFVANWTDKAANLREIAARLNIGLDSLVFLDDNPAERSLVRAELPAVAVPELPDDPALFPQALMDAGYFESVAVTEDDRARGAQYRDNARRDAAKTSATDMPSFLRSLQMRMLWRRFDRTGLARITQLINKTNQFNLTTRRYTEAEVSALIGDPEVLTLQLRLLDRFGDNGIVAIVIGHMAETCLEIDTWLMSCRVLGREVEAATLNLVAAQAQDLGARTLHGVYRPSPKNAMVRDHYARLGFAPARMGSQGESTSVLDLAGFVPAGTAISLEAA